jgi:hypothetical protein
MEPSIDWPARADAWLQRDHALLTEPDGWRARSAPGDIGLWSRRMPDDANDLFRWRLPVVNAPAEVVFEGFVHRILEHHRAWTREFAGGRVVDAPAAGRRVLHQRFEPGIPGVSPRDLCSAEAVRDLPPGTKLASFRSVDALAPTPGYERIDWWGAALCRTLDDGARSELTYLDRERQGGRIPSWLMNVVMPRYLIVQAERVRRFFADGGPPSLRGPRAA